MNEMKGDKDKNMRNKINISKKTNLKNLRKSSKGITLIALVITIVVLLILAAVSIATLTGQNGILTQANNAKTNTEIADEKEAIGLAYNGAMAKNNGNGVSYQDLNDQFTLNGRTDANASGANPITVTFDSGRTYTIDSNGNISDPEEANIIATMKIEGTRVKEPPMPSSGNFEHVAGTEVSNGYVIRDKDNGNEFVWVPVDKDQKIQINVTSKEENIESITLTDPYGDSIELPNIGSLGKSYNESIEPTINGPYVLKVSTATEEKTITLGVHTLYAFDTMMDWMLTEEYVASKMPGATLKDMLSQMGCETLEEAYGTFGAQLKNQYQGAEDSEIGLNHKESVKENGGFYIGRYEASYENGKVASKKSTLTNRAGPADELENGMLWNYVSQDDALRETKNMYSGISTLLTGAAWDRTLGWLKETGAVSSFKIVGDSSTWGNYSNDSFTNNNPASLINTGEKKETNKNNIYDLAGNLCEWTTGIPANNTNNRVFRGRKL